MSRMTCVRLLAVVIAVGVGRMTTAAQVDQMKAQQYFNEAAALCARDGGKLWGVSLCGPMVFADPVTQTIATNEPAPADKRPATLGFANAIATWGGKRWSTYVWPLIPADERDRAVLLIHELFHRVQPDLGFFLNEPDNSHLDSVEGRYWMQLEWRALAKALRSSGRVRADALRDALAFRAARRKAFPAAAHNERVLEVNEGLAQYTGTVVAATSPADAVAHATKQLERAPLSETFVRNFAYPSGAAYGVLLESWSPGWTRRSKPTDDIAELTATAATVTPSVDVEAAAARYDAAALRAAEVKRAADREALLKQLRATFVDGPVLLIPRARTATFVTNGMVPIAGAGTIYPNYRATTEWGSLAAERVLMSADRATIAVPAPASTTGTQLKGEGWTLTIAPGWVVRPGARKGDFVLVREQNP